MKSVIAITISFLAINAAAQPHLALERLAVALDRPDGIVSAGDARLFIVGARGRIFVYDGTGVLAQPFLDVSNLISPPVTSVPERGLLGLGAALMALGAFLVRQPTKSRK